MLSELAARLLETPPVLSAWSFALITSWLFGCCWGSFLNVCIWRLPRRESVVFVPSHCTSCGHPIAWYDNLPVLSFLVLRGCCRHCKKRYSARYAVIEALMGLLFVLMLLGAVRFFGNPFMVLRLWAAAWYFCGCAYLDARFRLIPDALSYPVLGYAVLLALLCPEAWGFDCSAVAALGQMALPALLWGALPGLFVLLGKVLFRRLPLSWGDVKMMLVSGALLGGTATLFIVWLGSTLGCLWGLLPMRRNHEKKPVSVPLAPFLAASAAVCLALSPYLQNLWRGIKS